MQSLRRRSDGGAMTPDRGTRRSETCQQQHNLEQQQGGQCINPLGEGAQRRRQPVAAVRRAIRPTWHTTTAPALAEIKMKPARLASLLLGALLACLLACPPARLPALPAVANAKVDSRRRRQRGSEPFGTSAQLHSSDVLATLSA